MRLIDADDAIKEIKHDLESLWYASDIKRYEEGVEFAINRLEDMETIDPKQEWISVKDRLPERTLPPHDVLVYHDLNCGMFVDRAWYSYDMGKWCSVLGMKLKVTHWMPLPEPPEREGE